MSWKVEPVSEKLEVSLTGQAPEDQIWSLFKSDDLSNNLGVTDANCGTVESQRQKGFAALGTFPVNLQGGRNTMFIYCDLVQNEIFGDSQPVLLRVIPLQQNVASTGATCYRTFDKMQWKRLNRSNFQSITISLCDESGQLMPFVSIGRTNSTLSFRRRKKHRHSVKVIFFEQLCGSGAIIIISIIIIIVFISNIIVVIMDSYYASQMASSCVGTFHGPIRQFSSGAGLGAIALRVGRTVMPLLKKFIGPFVKQVGQNVLEAALSEVVSLSKGKNESSR